MSNYPTQEETKHALIKRVVHLLFPTLRDALGPRTITRVNDFPDKGSVGSWEDHEWTDVEGQVRYSPTCIWIERGPNWPNDEG